MSPVPGADTHLPGAGCLLCLAAASVANSSLTAHAKTLPPQDLNSIRNDVVEALRRKGANVVAIADPIKVEDLPNASGSTPNTPRKDFSSLKQKYQLDRIVVVEIAQQGFERSYASYVPTSDPKGLVRGLVYMVNLKTQTYEWYEPINAIKASDTKWDEPPKFPGLTNAYFQAVETARETVVTPLAR